MELHHVALRALFAYVVLLALLRLSGKRTVAESTPFAFVLALIIGDMVDDLLLAEVGAAQFTVAVSTLAAAQMIVAWAAARSPRLDRLVSGRAVRVHGGRRARPRRDARGAHEREDRRLRAAPPRHRARPLARRRARPGGVERRRLRDRDPARAPGPRGDVPGTVDQAAGGGVSTG